MTREFPCSRLPTSQNWTNDLRSKLADECATRNDVRALQRNSCPNFEFSFQWWINFGFSYVEMNILPQLFLFCNIQFDLQSGQASTYILRSSSLQKWNDSYYSYIIILWITRSLVFTCLENDDCWDCRTTHLFATIFKVILFFSTGHLKIHLMLDLSK